MVIAIQRYSVALLIISIALTACNGQNGLATASTATAIIAVAIPTTPPPTHTPRPLPTVSPTVTESPTSAPTATSTSTVTPTETPVPGPVTLAGTVVLSGDNSKPFVTIVEIRERDSFLLIGKGSTTSNGQFSIPNVEPGIYQLWVLITTKPSMVSGCDDVAPPDATWKMGIKFGEDKALTIANAYLSKALLLSENIQASDLKASGFFAVMPDFTVKPGTENTAEVILMCQ